MTDNLLRIVRQAIGPKLLDLAAVGFHLGRGLPPRAMADASIDISLVSHDHLIDRHGIEVEIERGLRQLIKDVEWRTCGTICAVGGTLIGSRVASEVSGRPRARSTRLDMLKLIVPLLRLAPTDTPDSQTLLWVLLSKRDFKSQFVSPEPAVMASFPRLIAEAGLPVETLYYLAQAVGHLGKDVFAGIASNLYYSVEPAGTAHQRLAAIAEARRLWALIWQGNHP